MRHNSRVGSLGEKFAADILRDRGYDIVERNWRCSLGEIDIVAKENSTWAFVEVKTRTSLRYGAPEEAITHSKYARMTRTAECYLSEHNLGDVSWRLDIVAIQLSTKEEVVRFEIYPNAIEG